MTVIQNIIMHTILPWPEIFSEILKDEQLNKIALFFLNQIKLIAFLGSAAALAILISSIAFLKRQNWARMVFIVLIAIKILSSLIGLGIIIMAKSLITNFLSEIELSLLPLINIFTAIGLITTGATLVIFIWILKKLLSPEVCNAFIQQIQTPINE